MAHYTVGVTGGIGSGKTAVTDRFGALGITIVDADLASRAVVEPGRPALQAIAERFGTTIIAADGTLDRRALRDIVFSNPDERRWLEQLTHPLIAIEIDDQLRAAASAYAVLAHPLLLETGSQSRCQRVLVVDVPVETQIRRTIARDGSDRTQVEAIIAAQIGREQRLAAADDVIVNDQDLEHLDAEVARLHETYLAQAAAQRS
ncbi:MAG: dephospho-CoA kinase [Pseudomonadota bacterium]